MGMEVEIVKPRSDEREYRRIVLPNSLEVLLVSDPDTDKAAASMDVLVGSFSDPDGLEGLAHFLEHMLFYASEKYPEENSYSKYITEHGGSTNAFTASENTNFYFDVNADCFEEALDRFAQFFIKPLMSADATLREIKAVDSENKKNLLSDGWRMNQLQKHLSSNDHPYHKFGTGNWSTLEVIPKTKGLDTREELIKFYKKNYSASFMHLVAYGRGSLDEIQKLVEEKFVDIPNTGRTFSHVQGQPCAPEHLQIVVKAVPVKQGHKLKILWPITPSLRNYKCGPCMYLGHLIGHEGEGSLFCILKTLGWVTSLYAGEGECNYNFSFFTVTIQLTDAGHEHAEDIIGLLFKYILMLRKSGIQKWVFDELVAISETEFHFRDKIPPIDYVPNIACSMQLYPPEDWLVESSLPNKFAENTIQTVLDELTADNVRIFWESKKFEGCTDSVEPWYGTVYSIEKIDSSIVQQWILASPDANLHLPAPNVFIPTDLTIMSMQGKVQFPTLIRNSSCSRLWYKPDTMFFTPKAYINIAFDCPLSNHSPEAEILTEIFTRLLMDYLNEYAYDAQVAGLYYAVYLTDTGFQVLVVGYNHKMGILLETIIEKIAKFEVKADRFFVIKESVIKEYENVKFEKPYQQATYYCSLLLGDHLWPWNEVLEALCHLEANDLSMFTPYMLSKVFLKCYVGGNIESNEAQSLVQNIENVLFLSTPPTCKCLFPSQHLSQRIVKLEEGISYCYPVEVLNTSDENSALIQYIQVHQDDIKMNVKVQLFALVATQPAFHQLRSVEQLGYITYLTQRNVYGVRGLQFVIQSTAKDPVELDGRVDSFVEMFATKLCEMTEEEYKGHVNALINLKLEKFKNLSEESSCYWSEIALGTLRFDRTNAEVAALRELSQQELIDFFNNHIRIGAPQRKTLSIYVFSAQHSSAYKKAKFEDDQNNRSRIDDIFSFRKSRPLYGSLGSGISQSAL